MAVLLFICARMRHGLRTLFLFLSSKVPYLGLFVVGLYPGPCFQLSTNSMFHVGWGRAPDDCLQRRDALLRLGLTTRTRDVMATAASDESELLSQLGQHAGGEKLAL
jgi:hypothetical protein